MNTDAFSNGLRGVKVIQIRHVSFRTVFLDSFTHGQFFERLAEVESLVAVRHRGVAQNILRQGTEQGFGQLDQIFVVCVRHVEFHHGELRVVANGDTFVTEVTVDFEHTLEAANHQTFQVQFRRDTQVHVQIQRVVMGDERTSGRAARDHLHHRCFHFHKAAAHHELTDTRQNLRTHFESLAGFIVRDEIQVTLTVARFLILQAVEFVRQRTQCFGQQTQFGAVDRQLTGFGFEQLTFRAQNIAEVPFLELLVVDAFRQIVTRDVQLDTTANVLQRNEGRFTHNTTGHHTARNGDLDIQRFEFFAFLIIIFRMQKV